MMMIVVTMTSAATINCNRASQNVASGYYSWNVLVSPPRTFTHWLHRSVKLPSQHWIYSFALYSSMIFLYTMIKYKFEILSNYKLFFDKIQEVHLCSFFANINSISNCNWIVDKRKPKPQKNYIKKTKSHTELPKIDIITKVFNK